ncbi:MAG: glycosyltransferase [Patescibacteria group bacterium]|nr:glycosyltransferase [Patescibacteria group bacterium]MDD4304344.1 glycosyltransferase [Patescibacteria group bacterium]MDD4695367.1 glycosyltransferase [Patescibacteria group bacterium]
MPRVKKINQIPEVNISGEKKFDVIMFNMSNYIEWTAKGRSNRNFHILNNLKNHPNINKILAIDYLPHTKKRALRNWKENIWSAPNDETIKSGLFTRIYKIDDKITVYSTISNKINLNKTLENINKYAKKENFRNIILWSYYPLVTEYFDKIDHVISIFDTVDNWAEHASYCNIKDKIEENYKIISEKANIIFSLAKDTENMFSPRHEKIFQITQGIDLAHYSGKNKLINNDIAKIPHPIIGYVGVIQENRVNLDLIEYIANKNLDKSIVLIGPIWSDEDAIRLKKTSNIYLLGAKKYKETPDYINQFDVGIIPHYTNEFIKYTCPMKLYEYMACGIPIVTTNTPGVEQFKDHIRITNDFEKFNIYIQEELDTNSEEKINAKIQVIKEHTWMKKVDKMMSYIKKYI